MEGVALLHWMDGGAGMLRQKEPTRCSHAGPAATCRRAQELKGASCQTGKSNQHSAAAADGATGAGYPERGKKRDRHVPFCTEGERGEAREAQMGGRAGSQLAKQCTQLPTGVHQKHCIVIESEKSHGKVEGKSSAPLFLLSLNPEFNLLVLPVA
jgi:hypothetical protein